MLSADTDMKYALKQVCLYVFMTLLAVAGVGVYLFVSLLVEWLTAGVLLMHYSSVTNLLRLAVPMCLLTLSYVVLRQWNTRADPHQDVGFSETP